MIVDAASEAEANGALAVAISPHGVVRLEREPPTDRPHDLVATRSIQNAFAEGEGRGLLQLGLAQSDTELTPSLGYFRDFARLFVTRLCRTPDLEERRGDVHVPFDPDDLERFARAAPPMIGAEYVSTEMLGRLWNVLEAAFRDEVRASRGSVQDYLQARNPLWNLVGRVCFHLAENKRDATRPFAFLATYTTRLSNAERVQHLPLGRALTEYAGAKNRSALLSLLLPVQRAADKSVLVKDLVDAGEIYHPLAWTTRETYRFLREIPVIESSGVVVRVPDWWRARRGPRPEVRVTVGGTQPAEVGASAMLDFRAELTLGGDPISPDDWAALLASTDGLALIKGRWVEIDRDRLEDVLSHWKAVERKAKEDGVTFAEGMRLIAGAAIGGRASATTDLPADTDWTHVVAGEWLATRLEELRNPAASGAADPGDALKTTLRPYQAVGVAWLRILTGLGLGGCLADDMGLGKTIQVLALFLIVRRGSPRHPHLLVVPASLIANWKAEADRFAPDLRILVAHPSALTRAELANMDAARLADADIVLTSYGSLHRFPWLTHTEWDLVVLDEAQAIKNPGARQTRATKALKGRARIALTGTPVENRLGDLWSLFDFLCPGLLGSAKVFSGFVRRLAASDAPNPYAPLRSLVRPYVLRRLKTDKTIIADLPEKTEVRAFCTLTKKQAMLYQQSVKELAKELERAEEGIGRRGMILAYLMRLKQICNHPSQWLGNGAYASEESGKFARLRELCAPIAERQEKVLVFSQFREMTEPIAAFLEAVFARPGLVLHGGTPVKERQGLVERFQDESGPPFFVLSLKAGGTGLNLTAASHVVHFDRWWNPAVENQATDRAFRIGQKKNVLVHKFVCRGTIEERVDALIESKRDLATNVVDGGGEILLTEMANADILKLVSLDIHLALDEA